MVMLNVGQVFQGNVSFGEGLVGGGLQCLQEFQEVIEDKLLQSYDVGFDRFYRFF